MRFSTRAIIAFSVCASLLVSCKGNGGSGAQAVSAEFPRVEIPGIYTTREDVTKFYLSHFWDAFFKLPQSGVQGSIRGVETEEVEQAVCDYVTVAASVPYAQGRKSMEQFFAKLENAFSNDPSGFSALCEILRTYLYDPNSPYRDEDLYLPVASGLSVSPLTDESMRASYAYEARVCAMNKVGDRAADFVFRNSRGKDTALHSVKAEMTLLFFSNPGCQACKEIIDILSNTVELKDMVSSGRLAVVSVYIDEELDKWREYLPHYPSQWYVGYDPTFSLRDNTLYSIRAIPSLYLLDSEKNVILKDASEQKLFNYLMNL